MIPRAEFVPNDTDVTDLVKRIDAASKIVIMAGAEARGTADLLSALSDRLKAPLIHSVRGKEILPYSDQRWMGGIGMIGTKPVYQAVQDWHDLFLMVGTDYPYSNFLPQKPVVVQIDERAEVAGRRAPIRFGRRRFGTVRHSSWCSIGSRPKRR